MRALVLLDHDDTAGGRRLVSPKCPISMGGSGSGSEAKAAAGADAGGGRGPGEGGELTAERAKAPDLQWGVQTVESSCVNVTRAMDFLVLQPKMVQ